MRKITLDWVNDPGTDGVFGVPETRIYEVMPDGSRERVELEIRYVSE